MQCVAVKSSSARRVVRDHQEPDAGILDHRHRQGPRRTARARRLRNGRGGARSRAARAGIRSLSHHAQRARHRVPDGPPAPVAAQPAPARGNPRPPRNHQGGARLLRFPRLHAGGHADLHARRLRRHHHAVRSELLRRREGLPHAVRPALQRSHRHGVRQSLLLRAHLPRRKIQDAPPPHRVLDGGAGDGLRHAGRRQARGRGDCVVFIVGRVLENRREELQAPGARRRRSSKPSRRRFRA